MYQEECALLNLGILFLGLLLLLVLRVYVTIGIFLTSNFALHLRDSDLTSPIQRGDHNT